jgi:hypothetical protein
MFGHSKRGMVGYFSFTRSGKKDNICPGAFWSDLQKLNLILGAMIIVEIR